MTLEVDYCKVVAKLAHHAGATVWVDLLRLIPPHSRAKVDFSRKKISYGSVTVTPPIVYDSVVTVTPPPLQGLHA